MIEAERLEKIKRVIAHNDGRVLKESRTGQDVKVCVAKRQTPES